MIIGAHSIIYSKDAVADRAFLRDVLGLPHVDVGEGWLIFGLPPAEVAFHPSDGNERHEFYFMVEDVGALIAAMEKHGAACEPAQDMGWGVLTQVTLPGGGKLGFYQPRHARPQSMGAQAKVTKMTPSKPKSRRRRSRRRRSRRRGLEGEGLEDEELQGRQQESASRRKARHRGAACEGGEEAAHGAALEKRGSV